MSQTTITDIGTVGIPGQRPGQGGGSFFTGTLGFEKRLDARMGESPRWVTVAAPGASTSVALDRQAPTPGPTPASGSWFPTPKPSIRPCGNRASRSGTWPWWPGVPPMFTFHDPDGNTFGDRRGQRLSRQERGGAEGGSEAQVFRVVTLDTVKKHVTHVLGKLGARQPLRRGRASAPSARSSGVRNGPGVAGRTGRGNCGCSAPASRRRAHR